MVMKARNMSGKGRVGKIVSLYLGYIVSSRPSRAEVDPDSKKLKDTLLNKFSQCQFSKSILNWFKKKKNPKTKSAFQLFSLKYI